MCESTHSSSLVELQSSSQRQCNAQQHSSRHMAKLQASPVHSQQVTLDGSVRLVWKAILPIEYIEASSSGSLDARWLQVEGHVGHLAPLQGLGQGAL